MRIGLVLNDSERLALMRILADTPSYLRQDVLTIYGKLDAAIAGAGRLVTGMSGFLTKKALKEQAIGKKAEYVLIETGFLREVYHGDGDYVAVGHSPNKRNWHATVTVKDGRIAKVT